MADDVTARLRAALRAHAELVRERPDDAVPRSPGPRRAPRRWTGSVLVAAAAAAVVAGAGWLGGGGAGDSDPAAAPSPDAPVSGAAPSDDAAPGVQSAGAPPPVGLPRPFDLYTDCGVLGTDIGGVWFAAQPPLSDGAGNPPPGWGDPYQPGTLTVLSATAAVFRDDAGHEVRLRAAEDARPEPCW